MLSSAAKQTQQAPEPVQNKPSESQPAASGVAVPKKSKPVSEDREFLPAAIEILETPPSPVAVSFIWLIFAIFAIALAWAYFGKIEIYATASGKIQPNGRSKVVQPLEPGRVVAALVENGRVVHQGDVLLELDPTETAADEETTERDLESTIAEVARRRVAIRAAKLDPIETPPIQFPWSVSGQFRLREESVLAADIAGLAATLGGLDSQIEQQEAGIRRLTDSIAQRERVIAITKERVEMKDFLDKKGVGARLQVLDATERYESERATQVDEQGKLQEAKAASEATKKKLAETITHFVAEQTQKLVEAQRKTDRLEQELVKARSKNARTSIKAPISGVVQQLAITTVGQVVTSGQALMTIVPLGSKLEIEALILNKDIGFVRIGQPAVVKLEAFPFGRYGALAGTVTNISSDAIDMRNAPNLSEAAATVRPQGAPPNSSASGPELVFPATVALSSSAIDVGGSKANLSPGMTVTVEIATGKRRIIDFVLSPLREVFSQAGHER